MNDSNMIHRVVVQKWEESERNWGTRPDGYSLHLTEEDLAAYLSLYWSQMPDLVPDEYSRPDGTPYWTDTDEETYRKVTESENGVRFWGTPPGSGGTNRWV